MEQLGTCLTWDVVLSAAPLQRTLLFYIYSDKIAISNMQTDLYSLLTNAQAKQTELV